ncbi:glycosyltransferase family 4 protein [Candidatus Aminicenantes bacterium AC-708-M15]|jgi:glycosyltransferase involved in cell wall biosynthesis|nr:glycosyltransferase family 4 protein [SCandidatus Aminicenantes bacterium Aminicenantia_JdfR_composite]MCP2596373.1 glycosyltransferase family 4 protein [Candidatus Aminicenantes bacterium AC-335-G13]MCP2604098.1 glycosyltransferase family 4 protein [Candidatus Aminicenantes bacterium AC-708-M15]MCP2605387.1 glycosyltransferase family 4 protein [Candidatus Aminicenantes bacterium AC-335-O07]MCP2606002.1 glycosyltransferase family 4 protein [Candidatus Aminicenantes bacterium AC-708-I09]MCP2
MKILMLAPEPFFQPRGTPLSEYFRIKALSDLGYATDLVTYHIGEDVEIENLKIYRIPKIPFIKEVKVGPSLTKVFLDFFLIIKAVERLLKERYSLIFSHEEGAFFGVILAKIWKIPHLYDMHSSLPQQLENFQFSRSRILKKIFTWIEKFVLRNSERVIVICKDLLNTAKKIIPEDKIFLIENFLTLEGKEYSDTDIKRKKKELGINNKKIVVYAGTFESYQGIPLLLEAFKKLDHNVVLLLLGGKPKQIEELKNIALKLDLLDKIFFLGQVSPLEIPIYLSMADVLVSPRLRGTNTPLKIYSYLKSGKPIVATKLPTHLQVLNSENSILVEPNPESFAEGIKFALYNPKAKEIALNAKKFAEQEYTYKNYLIKVKNTMNFLENKS